MSDADAMRRLLDEADCLAGEAQVREAITVVAARIAADMAALDPVVLCVLKGGVVFAGQLLTQLQFPLDFDYVHATRYGYGTTGGGIDWRVRPSLPLFGRHVLLLDDILDVGSTLLAIADACHAQQAASVRTAVLVDKVHARKARPGLRADYTALEMPDRFLFGYGMDYQGYWRNAPGIYAVKGH